MFDEKIFTDFQRGKIEPLYQNMYGDLLLYASRRLGGDVAFMAEDCVQDAI